jgi:hypothetical protein
MSVRVLAEDGIDLSTLSLRFRRHLSRWYGIETGPNSRFNPLEGVERDGWRTGEGRGLRMGRHRTKDGRDDRRWTVNKIQMSTNTGSAIPERTHSG